MGGIDDAIKAMEEDSTGATKLPPIQYAKLRGIRPQKVYAAIRNHRLEHIWCDCGRKVVIIDDADKLFRLGAYDAAHTSERDPGDEALSDPGEEEGLLSDV
jgi:hypothetical protein